MMITKQTSPMVRSNRHCHLYAAWKVRLVFWFPKLEYKRYSGEIRRRQNWWKSKKVETAVSMARLNSENCGRICDSNTALFLLATRISPASPNFGQAKHGQNGPAATVCQQCICCPICGHHFTHWTHPDISFRFRAGGRRLKNFRFSRISMATCQKYSSACCGLNFNATDLPHS